MRIGLSSIVGDGFGTGSFQISEIAGEISFPTAGTFNSWLYNVDYPANQGGGFFTIEGINYLNQFCDVIVKNDGSGGTYTDWATATDVQYKNYGTFVVTLISDVDINIPTSCSGSLDVSVGTMSQDVNHDGGGSYYSSGTSYSYISNGTQIYYESCDDGSGNYIDTYYYSDGSGGYYSV